MKLCECGCGLPAPIAERKRGQVAKGEPMRYRNGHAGARNVANLTPHQFQPRNPQKMAEAVRLYRETDLTAYAIALRLGLTLGSVKTAVSRAGVTRRDRLDWTNALAADGPTIAAWLGPILARREGAPAAVRDRLHHWARGERCGIWALDRVLVTLGLHLSQVPAEAWVPYRREAAA